MNQYILSIDQGTTSTRALLVDHAGTIIAKAQHEHAQIFPQPGWVEHDPIEIWQNTVLAINEVISEIGINSTEISGVGITNQRETVIVWDKTTGIPLYNAIVWQDTRTQTQIEALIGEHGLDFLRESTGLPLSTYFSASKLAWILDNVPNARQLATDGKLLFGTPDTWLLWNLSGGISGGIHITDVTNASRTQLMNLETLDWDPKLCVFFNIPPSVLPTIRSSSEVYTEATTPPVITGTSLAGILGDQHAATFGQAIFEPGIAKNTYGTGNFLLVNTGLTPLHSQNGLITTVAYKLGDSPAHYALEGSVAVTGSLVQWLRDNLGIISSSAEVEELAQQVPDNGGVYFVPAFSGLFAPYWRPDARGIIAGLTRFVNKNHIARAVLEATAFQAADLLNALNQDLPSPLKELRVDGGMVNNEILMQFQTDLLQIPVLRPKESETTALGAAYVAGLAVGFWRDTRELESMWQEDTRWESSMAEPARNEHLKQWKKAVERTLNWTD